MNNNFRWLMSAATATLGAIAFFTSTAAHAASEEEQSKACRADAFHFCASDIPNKKKITACMKQHIDELSPGCRAMFNNGSKGSGRKSAPK